MNERSKAKKNKKKYKEEQNDELFKKWKYIDFALKTQAAAFSHGEFGYWRSRMKDYKVAEAITSTTKKFIFFMMDKLEELGFEWVYSHTDSIYIKCKKKDIDELLSSVDLIVKSYCKEHGYRKEAILEFEQFYQRAYIHSPARNVLIAKTKDIDEPDKWVDPPNKVTGMNFFRSETPEALRRIEIDLVKLKLKRKSVISLIRYLKQAISNLGDLDSRELGIIKPLNKPINEYGGETEDGRKIPIPYHIQAYLDANEEYGFELEEGEKFMVLPILTDETTGTRKIKRVRNYIAFPISKGLPKQYDIDYEYYLKSNLYGKVYKLFDIPEDILEECVRDYIPNIKKANGIVEKAMEEKDDS